MNEMERLASACENCERCVLGKSRTKLVFGDGNPESKILFIGEGPGEQEDLQGLPFVGAAGKLLDELLEMIGLDRSKVYIANTVKCRPPHNRDPEHMELDACRTWLDRQIAILQPRLVVCLGRIAAGEIIHENFRMTREHGEISEQNGVFYMATYHPSALLRDLGRRPEAFGDWRCIRSVIRDNGLLNP